MKLRKDIWTSANLGDVTLELKNGFSSGKFELNEKEVKHIRPMNITDDCKFTFEGTKFITTEVFELNDSLKLSKGDLLFNNTNSTELVGKPCFIDNDYELGFSNHMTRIKVDNKKLNSYYLSVIFYGYFTNRIFESYCQKWVGQSGLNRNIISQIEIPIPPLEEQKQIAVLFQSIETAMELVDGQEKTLLNLKNKLLKDLFSEQKQFGNHLKEKDF